MPQDKVIIVEGGQTIYDIALQEYGSKDAVFDVLIDNPELDGFDTILQAGQLIKINQKPINPGLVEYFKELNIKPATEVDNLDDFVLIGSQGDFDMDDFDGNDFY